MRRQWHGAAPTTGPSSSRDLPRRSSPGKRNLGIRFERQVLGHCGDFGRLLYRGKILKVRDKPLAAEIDCLVGCGSAPLATYFVKLAPMPCGHGRRNGATTSSIFCCDCGSRKYDGCRRAKAAHVTAIAEPTDPWTGGVALLPAYAQNFLTPSVTSRPLKGDAPTVDLVLGYKKSNRSPILKLLLSKVDELVARASGKAR